VGGSPTCEGRRGRLVTLEGGQSEEQIVIRRVAAWGGELYLTQGVFKVNFAEANSPTNPSTCPFLLLA